MHWHIVAKHENFKMPTRGLNPETGEVDPHSVGFDLYAPESGLIDPLSRKLIGLGFASEFTEGWVGRYFDRSGMGSKGITHFGGTIDPSYRGEWKLVLFNSTGETFHWKAGDRLIQVVFMPVGLPLPVTVKALTVTERGAGGLGSTGK